MPIVNGLQTIVNRSGEDLRGAVLREANLTRTDFTGTNLSGADLTSADLSFSVFNGADLTDADLRNANLTDADLVGAIKNNSEFVREYSIEGIPDILIPLALQITNYDGDGYNHNNYVDNVQWQELKNEVWSDIAIDTGIYYTANYGEDQTIRALITYTDGEGFSQTVQSISKSFNLQNPIESSSSEIINVEPSQGLANESNTSQDNQTSSSNIISDNLQSSPQERLDQENVPQENNQENVENPAISIRDSLRSSTFEIRGTAKVGETMTVGYNLTETAVDADNASGALAGSYNYKWQLSGDGGSSWTTVATNADYKITTADVDKKLRALVSYTDDGGTPHTDIASGNSLDTVSLAKIIVDNTQPLIEYRYRIRKTGKSENLHCILAWSRDQGNTAWDLAKNDTYELIVEAKTLSNGNINGNDVTWNLETFDINLEFTNDIFSEWGLSQNITFGNNIKNAKSYKFTNSASGKDSVRITGANSSNLYANSSAIQDNYQELLKIGNLKISEEKALELQNRYGSSNVFLDIGIETNLHDTVVSHYQDTDNNDYIDNAYITSLASLGYDSDNSGQNINIEKPIKLHEAYADLKSHGTSLWQQRIIGNKNNSFLLRKGSTVNSRSWISNVGSFGTDLGNLDFQTKDNNSDLSLVSTIDIQNLSSNGDNFLEGFDIVNCTQSSETFSVDMLVKVSGSAGTSIRDNFFTLTGDDINSDSQLNSEQKITNNIITHQGDLDFDGRVSLKDLAYLNAGKIYAINNNENAPSDVDANHDGLITISDLSVLENDWNKTIYNSVSQTQIVDEASWDSPDVEDPNHPDWFAGTIEEGTTIIRYDNSSLQDSLNLNFNSIYVDSIF